MMNPIFYPRLYTYEDIVSALIVNAPQILSRTPCSLTEVATILVSKGLASTTVEAEESFLDLARDYPHIFILEKEGASLGYFLIFYYCEQLKKLLPNVNFWNERQLASENVHSSGSDLISMLEDEEMDSEIASICKRIQEATIPASELEKLALQRLKKSFSDVPLTLICPSEDYAACVAAHSKSGKKGKPECSSKIHLERVLLPHTDASLGDCSYLDTCFKGKQCKYVHYRILHPSEVSQVETDTETLRPPQFVNTNLLKLKLSLLGSDYKALVIDPPWDIHTNPNFDGGCSDADFEKLDIKCLQTNGIIFLWVTGRVLDLGRKCLKDWGYSNIEEVLWLKTNQLGRMICTGRTGHWLNHTKEHLLVGTKGNAVPPFRRMLDADVLVSNALGKSQKPSELYAMIDRLVGRDARKLELFGRPSNIRPGWITIGNEFGFTQLNDPELKARLLPALFDGTISPEQN